MIGSIAEILVHGRAESALEEEAEVLGELVVGVELKLRRGYSAIVVLGEACGREAPVVAVIAIDERQRRGESELVCDGEPATDTKLEKVGIVLVILVHPVEERHEERVDEREAVVPVHRGIGLVVGPEVAVAVMGIVVPHDRGAVIETDGLIVIEPERPAPMDVEIPLVERLAVAGAALVCEVGVRPNADTDVAEVEIVALEIHIALDIALEGRLGVDERTVELIAGVDAVVAEAPEELVDRLGSLCRLDDRLLFDGRSGLLFNNWSGLLFDNWSGLLFDNGSYGFIGKRIKRRRRTKRNHQFFHYTCPF